MVPSMDEYVLGIDIGGTNLRMGTVTKNGVLSNFERKSSASLLKGNASGNLMKEINAYIDRYRLREQVIGICIGVPATVNKDKSFIFSAPNLHGLQNIDLGRLIKESTGIPTIVDRDVYYLLMYDIMTMNLDPNHDKTILGIYIGTGIGNAIYINGKVYVGKNGVAGELGHIPMYHNSEACMCGNRGCAEVVCSGLKLEKLAKEKFPDCRVRDIFLKHGDSPEIKEFIDTLSLPAATEITLLDPDFVIIGGGVTMMKDFPFDDFLDAIRAHTRHPMPAESICFLKSKKSQTNGVIGGSYATFDTLKRYYNS
ncbi:D-allose kinase [Caprobacter fermentans]|uniref:D-allose kinase n=2 Tax=Caproicibacter fermentans TaxID=2576756 RepID=A0A6N8I1W4_9FIRM|nr:D-allose kinase [Caproicibacter fermentans]